MRKFAKPTTLFLATLAALGLLATAAVAVPDAEDERPTKWAPTRIVSVMKQNPTHVTYWFKWSGPGSTTSSRWVANDTTFEFGWKDTSKDGCDNSTAFGEAGWPGGMDIQVDWTEDSDDAVVWMDSVDQLKTDIDANPNKEYSVWWTCDGNDHFESAGNPNFQVQLGEADFPSEPWTTFSLATMNYVPAEQGGKGVPTDQNDNRQIQTNMNAPWFSNSNFENAVVGWNGASSNILSVGGNQPHQGQSFAHVRPLVAGQGNQVSSWMWQNFKVGNNGTKDPQFELGNNTGLQYEGAFRCPTWGDDWAGVPGQPCKFTIWMKTFAEPDWYSKTYTIPADWNWYYVLDSGSPSMNSDDDIQFWINTHGFPIDVDAQWMSSDI